MVSISILRPMDQPLGNKRLLEEMKVCLATTDFTHFIFTVAFAQSGPLLRMNNLLEEWKSAGKTIKAILGIDFCGTSKQALEIALRLFDETYVTHSISSITFHPKMYLFYGEKNATFFIGSHNLTVAGTETNVEAGMKIVLNREEDEELFSEIISSWETLLPANCPMTKPLSPALIGDLLAKKKIFDESESRSWVTSGGPGNPASGTSASTSVFPWFRPKPASPLPKDLFVKKAKVSMPKKRKSGAPATPPPPIAPPVPQVATPAVSTEALVIQIVPHHNGEVFLSKIAVNQNPIFFGYPFTGMARPKKSGNPSYPQRMPDPVVDITVYDASEVIVVTKPSFSLNTVYYEPKHEIRITVSPDLQKVIRPYAVMVMRKGTGPLDYVMDIYNPGSNAYTEYMAICNQTLPAGKAGGTARKMGWM